MEKSDKLPGPDNFELSLVRETRGYLSSTDPTTTAAPFLVKGSQNVYKDSAGNIAVREGRKQFTGEAVDGTIAGVKSAYVWNTSLGKKYPLRTANSKLQFLSDIVTSGTFVWYDLLTSLTVTRGVYDTIWDNTAKKDFLVVVLGNTSLYAWSGGVTLAASGTLNTITKQGATTWAEEGFTATGTVVIGGVEYAYTGGYATTTLTGVTGTAVGVAAGIAYQKITTNTTTPAAGFNNDFIKTIGNRLHVGSYTSRNIYISANDNYADYSVPGTRVAGDPELLTLDDTANGIGVRQGKAYISAGQSDWYIVSYESITVGSSLTEQTSVDKQESSNGAAAYAHEFIEVANDTIIFLSKDQQLRAFGTFRNLNTPAYPVLSLAIDDELADTDFSLGQLKIIASAELGELVYLIAPNSGKVFLHQTKSQIDPMGNIISERIWHAPFVWGISRIDVYNGRVLGFSNANPQTYYLWDTGQWHDDTPSGEVPYISIMLMSYQNYGRRQGKLQFDKIYWEGYMTQGTVLTGTVYFDYQGASGLIAPIIHDPINSPANNQSFFTGVVPPSLGDASLGENPLGSPTDTVGIGATELNDHDLLSKFRIITGVPITQFCEAALMCYSNSLDARWEIIAVGTNVSEAPASGIEFIKNQV